MEELAFRQIHLDFHTSGQIEGVGDEFDSNEFVSVLKAARANSITCFAKCHHGYSYYPTKVGTRHPGLSRDLLGEQVEACHRAGIRVPAYISVVWDEDAAARHQDWLQVDRQGRQVGRGPLDAQGWRWLCMNNADYTQYLEQQTEEVLRGYPVDGIFFDIVVQTQPGCFCNACRARLAAAGADPADDDALRLQSLEIARDFIHRMTTLVHHIRPEASVFYNSRTRISADPQRGMRHELQWFTHVEIESLPTGGWGYNHFPLFARYFQTMGKEMLGMTARFHRSWADFGGLKQRAALEYECFSMLAAGAKCSIGDQLHPRGRLERPAYERIGQVFRSVEAKEPWCEGAVPIAEIGVVLAQGQPGVAGADGRDTDEGIMRLLLQSGRTFQMLDLESDLADYPLVILPDSIRVGHALHARLRDYVEQGGRLILTGESGLDPEGAAFAVKEAGVRSMGQSPWNTPFVRVPAGSPLAVDVEPMDHVIYERGWAVEAERGTEVLAWEVPPFFNRDHRLFSSHAHTPPVVAPGSPLPDGCRPAATRRGQVVYFAAPLARAYRRNGSRVYQALLANAVDLLLPERLVSTTLPPAGQVSVLHQPQHGSRLVAHLLYYLAERRTPQIDIVEDPVTLHDVRLTLRPGFRPRRVYEAPGGRALDATWDGKCATVTLAQLCGHGMVVFEP